MVTVEIKAEKLRKVFSRKTIFSDISFSLETHRSLSITGRNGAGKSTLLKVLTSLLAPSSGSITLTKDGSRIPATHHFQHIGFVAPYLQLYDEFTAWENLDLMRKIRNVDAHDEYLDELLKKVNLFPRKDDFVRTYSSGMKQRIKYACALVHKPFVLMLDEPTANLDAEGQEIVRQVIEEQKQKGIVIIATNESDEISWCNDVVDLDKQQERIAVV